ncbi:MAG: hypothetical protein ACC656_04255 [Candidatus Heimdallarchaeota archaeon]
MNEKTFRQLQEKARALFSRFPNRWDEKTCYVNLVEEIGELGNALLVKNKDKSIKRKRADFEDSFADILFSLIMMADESNVDLERSLSNMLEDLEVRLDNKEYEN